MDLAATVRQYYLNHFDELPIDKQFHFAGRLADWESNKDCFTHLEQLRDLILPAGTAPITLLSDLIHNPPEAKINAAGARDIYFARYPALRGRMLGMFRVRHARDVYGIDWRDALLDTVSHRELRSLGEALSQDDNALRILSTYAINYLYLLDILFPDTYEDLLDIKHFFALSDAYNLDDPEAVQLLIYLYTHCIIGESNFYIRKVDPSRSEMYLQMLKRLEDIIDKHFDVINLDNKLEFLVCCRIMAYASELDARIYGECSRSLSREGDFLIDRHNQHMQSDKKSFADSEHRNVLFIMSTSPYPHAA